MQGIDNLMPGFIQTAAECGSNITSTMLEIAKEIDKTNATAR
jgi:hypothetical protein